MKTLLKTSLCLNLGLAAGLVFVLLNGPKRDAGPVPPVVAKTRPQVSQVASNTAPSSATAAGPKPFRWSQLESKDYRTYVQNLRAIGCPEETVRAIVSADADVVFGRRREVLERQLSGLNNGSWTARLAAAQTVAALKDELRNQPAAETALINQMLGLQATPAAEAGLAASGRRPAEEPAPVMPLIWQNVDPAQLNLSDSQIQVVNDLRQSFLDQIGGTNQDPNDPAYLKRWQKAQPQTDNMLRGTLGTSLYQQYQLAAFQNEQRAAAGNNQNPAANP